jgi:penicillin-binding protein 1B
MIFTTLDPLIQITSEQAMKARLDKLEAARDLAQHEMQAAVVVANVDNGEVLALVGGRDPRLPGYNRALDARRPVGSLIKPVVFLTALSQPEHYTLATHLDDVPLSVRLSDDQLWSPQNYDRKAHGQVMLRDALVQSYNLSTARLGLAVGIDDVARNLRTLGLQRSVPVYPSLLLGAVEMSPLEVGQIYQTIASGGYRVPLRAIREVMNWQGVPLQRYPLNIEQVLDPSAAYLLTAALHEVTQQGTAKSLKALLRQDLQVAGKTGTTNGLRDSWFAGYSGEHLTVVWVGRDNNQPTGLSGATGALPVWGDIMRAISRQSLNMTVPANVEWKLIDPSSGLLADDYCMGAQWIPFIDGTAPKAHAQCGRASAQPAKRTWKWLHDLFE